MYEILYHYTTLEALLNMVEDKQIRFRATHIDFMNDPTERIHSVQILTKYLREVEKELKIESKQMISPIFEETLQIHDRKGLAEWIKRNGHQDISLYSISFSPKPDSLPMWNMYAQNGSGIALGFNFKDLKLILGKGTKVRYTSPQEIDVKKNKEIILALCEFYKGYQNKSKEDKIKAFIAGWAFIFKNDAYSYEEEYRFCNYYSDFDPTKFRVRNGILIPYVDNYLLPCKAINKIIVGPTFNFELSRDSLLQFLHLHQIQLTKGQVIPSEIPYRL